MNPFDLLFIGLFFGTLIYTGWIAVLAARRRWPETRRHALRLGCGLGIYMLIVLVTGILSPRRVLTSDQTLRYDDWRLGVETVSFAPAVGSVIPSQKDRQFAVVTLVIKSTARRIRQAAPAGALVYLANGDDVRFDVADAAQAAFETLHGAQPVLTTKLDPGQSFKTTRVFEVPRAATELFLGHRHGSGNHFPGAFIIGEGFRAPALIRLPAANEMPPARAQ